MRSVLGSWACIGTADSVDLTETRKLTRTGCEAGTGRDVTANGGGKISRISMLSFKIAPYNR
jgi:hypothetical protein